MIGGLVVYEAVMMTGVGEGWSKKDCTAQTEACSRVAVGRGGARSSQQQSWQRAASAVP